MFKKLIFYCIILFAGTLLVFQSCSDSSVPVQSPENEIGLAGNGCGYLYPNLFTGIGLIKTPNSCFSQPPYNTDPNLNPTTIDLWIGVGNQTAGYKAGILELSNVTGGLKFQFKFNEIPENYLINAIHIDIANSYEDLHKTSTGNPSPGQFDKVVEYDPPIVPQNLEVIVPYPTGGNGTYFIAAHLGALTGEQNIQLLNELLPIQNPLFCAGITNISYNYEGGTYLKFDLTNAGSFNGHYESWCIDNASMSTWPYTCVKLYSIYENWPDSLSGWPRIEHPENFRRVNWLINHFSAGGTINGLTITVDDIQDAIWGLLDQFIPGIGEPVVVNALINATYGKENYDPCVEYEDMVFIAAPILDPENGWFSAQPVLIKIPCNYLPPSGGGTIWADGKGGANFHGNNWGTFFKWKLK